MSSIRCFVAAELPQEVRDDLARLQGRLRALGVRARWVPPDAMHLTVKFLGEIAPSTFDAVREALRAPLDTGGPLRLTPHGLGCFPSPRRPRVAWVGLEGDRAPLARAALTVEARVEPLGVPREARPFRAHLTLARPRGPSVIEGLDRALETEAGYRGPEFALTGLVLYESRLRPEGPLHTPRLAIPFA